MLSLLDQAGAKVMVHVEWELPHRGRGKLEFFEYSNSKVCNHSPNIVEYDDDKLKKPVFKFILGPETMMKKGLSQQVITKDESPCIKRFANA